MKKHISFLIIMVIVGFCTTLSANPALEKKSPQQIKKDCDLAIKAICRNEESWLLEILNTYTDADEIKALLSTQQSYCSNILSAAIINGNDAWRSKRGESSEDRAMKMAKIVLDKAAVVSTAFQAEIILHRRKFLWIFKDQSPYRIAQRYKYKKVLEVFDDICKRAGCRFDK
jgi:hypothetical protein